MAWTASGVSWGGADKAGGTTFTITVQTSDLQNVAAGSVVVVCIALDNRLGTDGDNGDVASISDSAGGNTWTKIREFCNGQGGANAGATASIWYSKLATQLVHASTTMTVTFTASTAARAIKCFKFTIGLATVAQVGGGNLANDNADPGSISVSGLANAEHLFVRCTARENTNAAYTPTASYTASTHGTSGGSAATNMSVAMEYRILTATSDSTNPTWGSADHASTMAALDEQAAGSTVLQDVVGVGVVPFPR